MYCLNEAYYIEDYLPARHSHNTEQSKTKTLKQTAGSLGYHNTHSAPVKYCTAPSNYFPPKKPIRHGTRHILYNPISRHQILFATISYLLTPSIPAMPPFPPFPPLFALKSRSRNALNPSGSSAYIHARRSSPTSTDPQPPTRLLPSTVKSSIEAFLVAVLVGTGTGRDCDCDCGMGAVEGCFGSDALPLMVLEELGLELREDALHTSRSRSFMLLYLARAQLRRNMPRTSFARRRVTYRRRMRMTVKMGTNAAGDGITCVIRLWNNADIWEREVGTGDGRYWVKMDEPGAREGEADAE